MAVSGESHTLLNLLQSFLLSDRAIKMAGYSKPHPLMDRSILILNLKKKKGYKEALLSSADKAKMTITDFLKRFEDELHKKG
jgi:DNA-directed RNA polymerase subunit L